LELLSQKTAIFRPKSAFQVQKPKKTVEIGRFSIDFTHLEAALFSTTGFCTNPHEYRGFVQTLPRSHSLHAVRFMASSISCGEPGGGNPRQQPREGEHHMATGLTKTALTRHLAEKLELTNKQSAAFLDLLAETAIKETKKNGVFVIPGIGRLVKAERKARIGRNPQTGEAIKIKAKTVVKFRVAKAAKDVIAPPKK
jgi:DNA-binding protein HU-beta